MTIAVCLKLVDTRPELDPTGTVHDADERFSGVSPADQAALEWALRTADAWGDEVLAVTVGPPGAERILRDALAVGAHHVLRIELSSSVPSDIVAGALAEQLGGSDIVWCGDHSLDRGTGAVPAFLAARLAAAQALGLVQIELRGPRELDVVRRLDGGRRERLAVAAPAVLSVEGSAARLRRAPLQAALRARSAPVPMVPGPLVTEHAHGPTRWFRPRPRVLGSPSGTSSLERIRSLTDVGSATSGGEIVVLEPSAAAQRIVDALRAWGYTD